MKILIGLFAALLALSGVLALPAKSPNDDAEVISVPRRPVSSDEDDGTDFRDFKGFIDTGSGYPFLQPHPPPFSFNLGFFDTFDDIMRRFRERMWPVAGDDSDSTEIASRGSFDLDSKNANSTSTVKVVNGHKIEVNETVYGDDDSSFRVRIVNIRPLESGEEVEETVHTNVASGKPADNNPVTSAPKKEREDIDDSDERREPLERDNEIRNSLNEQKASESNNNNIGSTLSTIGKTSSQDNRSANLNAAFVTDNRFEETENRNGNIEAETNKPTESKMLENYDETTITATVEQEEEEEEAAIEAEADGATTIEAALDDEASTNAPIDAVAEAAEDVISSVSAAVQDASLTIENNEETETNDNFNESSEDAGNAATAVEITKDLNKLTLNENADNVQEENVENASSTLELNGEVVVPVTSAIETFSVEHFGNGEKYEGHSVGDVSESLDLTHSRDLILVGRIEDSSSSSDDESFEPLEMNPVFNSEWGNLSADIDNVNDQNNDLSNDIDVYAAVPIDLSNDIAVNEIAAAQADFPINPDAEFIDINGVITNSSSMPKFEKLSLSTSFQPETIEMSPTK